MRNVAALSVSRSRSDICNELLDACDAKPTESVVIVGSGHMDLLVVLCRRGFARVTCQTSSAGVRCLDTPVDVLILPNCSSEPKLRCAIARFDRVMGKGARIALCIPSVPPSRPLQYWHVLLAGRSFHPTQCSKRLSDGSTVYVARRGAAPVCAASASLSGRIQSAELFATTLTA
jgi:hypothetical protein